MTESLNLFNSRRVDIDKAYIITVKGNESSERYSKRCQQSCDSIDMPYQTWDAFDGTKPGKIVVPDHSKNDSVISMLKVTDHYLTRGEVACALSHISLWVHCARIDKPIVILEHDALMIQKIQAVNSYNSIVYLGGSEWVEQGWKMYPIPPHASEGPNYLFICRAHAYAIDPTMARNLVSHVIRVGICDPLDIMMRADLFNITHQGCYAYDNSLDVSNDTTIKARPPTGRTTVRNDSLEY